MGQPVCCPSNERKCLSGSTMVREHTGAVSKWKLTQTITLETLPSKKRIMKSQEGKMYHTSPMLLGKVAKNGETP